MHLTHIYQKLGVANRAELRTYLRDKTDETSCKSARN
jgi:DNA-binding CsgD family transcriptional regulator